MTKSLRVLIAVVIVSAMLYGAAVTLALTGNLGSAPAVIVVVVGALLLPIALFILRRRLWSPLSALGSGIQRVAEGDLTTQIAVRGDAELGKIAAHFNHMTRVLRDRAEEQEHFAPADAPPSGEAHGVNDQLLASANE